MASPFTLAIAAEDVLVSKPLVRRVEVERPVVDGSYPEGSLTTVRVFLSYEFFDMSTLTLAKDEQWAEFTVDLENDNYAGIVPYAESLVAVDLFELNPVNVAALYPEEPEMASQPS